MTTNVVRIFGIVACLGGATMVGPAFARGEDDPCDENRGRAVFVQTNGLGGNAIVAYPRNADGALAPPQVYPTGGNGGKADGVKTDSLDSQGSLVYVRGHRLLLAVNAGSDSVSVFRVEKARLELTQVVSSGGPFPVSIAVRHDLVYVLDAGSEGFVTGYRIDDDRLEPIEGSSRSLGLANTNPPFFQTSPAQVGFTPDGKHLVVTTKGNGTVDVFAVQSDGRLSSEPVKNPQGNAPFAFLFDPGGVLVLNTAIDSAVATFHVDRDGTLTAVGPAVSDGQIAACWIVRARGYTYVANSGNGTISRYRIAGDGAVTLLEPVAASVTTASDMATADRGRFLYVESGTAGSIFAYEVCRDGSLRLIQSLSVPGGANLQGIAAN